MIDTLRPDHLELYGHERVTAPFLAELGESAVVFTNAFSTSSKTTPSTASLFTGTYPTRHGVLKGVEVARKKVERVRRGEEESVRVQVIPSAMTTLPEHFRAAGYRTFGVVANTQVDDELGFSRGFDRFICLDWKDADETIPSLLAWQEEIVSSERPTFLYLHFIDPHSPYNARAPWYESQEDENEEERNKYESEIRYLDGKLAELHKRFGWGEDTIFVALSDHGEEFGDHGGIGHRYSLYDELNRVLLLVAGGGGGSSTRVDVNVSLVDVLPTLLDLVGIEKPEGLDGVSLARFMNGTADSAFEEGLRQRTLLAHRATLNGARHLWSVRRGPWKTIQLHDSEPALFNVLDDPGETENLAGEEVGILEGLRLELERLQEDAFPPSDEFIEIELTPEGVDHLDGLGYVEDPEEEDE